MHRRSTRIFFVYYSPAARAAGEFARVETGFIGSLAFHIRTRRSLQRKEMMNIDNPEMARTVAEATAALNARMAPSQAVTRAGAMLQVARLGLRDMHESNEYRILLGFFGVVVFGRSITLVTQNFRRYDEAALIGGMRPGETK